MEFVGKGIYSVQLASDLTGVPPSKIRRWMLGYVSESRGSSRSKAPLFKPEYGGSEGIRSLSFLDLVEITFIDALRKHGFSLQQIRLAAERAAATFETAHPFALKKLYTDGSRIFLRILEDEPNSAQLIDLRARQFQLDSLVLPSLMECIEFNNFDVASRWWPAGRTSPVVIDPEVLWGKPHISGYGLSTSMVAGLIGKGRSESEVAEWYEVPVDLVRQAVEFESSLVA